VFTRSPDKSGSQRSPQSKGLLPICPPIALRWRKGFRAKNRQALLLSGRRPRTGIYPRRFSPSITLLEKRTPWNFKRMLKNKNHRNYLRFVGRSDPKPQVYANHFVLACSICHAVSVPLGVS